MHPPRTLLFALFLSAVLLPVGVGAESAAVPSTEDPAEATWAAIDRDELSALLAPLGAASTLRCRFEQTKHLSMLAAETRSAGSFVYQRAHDRLAFSYDPPVDSLFVIEGSTLRSENRALGTVEEIALGDSEVGRRIFASMQVWVSAEVDPMLAAWEVRRRGEGSERALRLTPRDESLAASISALELGLDAEGLLRQLVIEEPDGDFTRFDFSDLVAEGG